MPTFDVVSEVDMQEVKNAVDQASREVATRFDFKGTGARVELKGAEIELQIEGSAMSDAADRPDANPRLAALTQVLEEKLVRRKVSLKALGYGKVEDAAKGTVRQVVKLNTGINQEKAKQLGKFIKELGLKGVSHQVQGDQLRVSGKKRDDLQSVIQAMREKDFGIPLEFTNFRD